MKTNRAQFISGLILIALGIAFLLMQFFDLGPGVLLALLGGAFLIFYALTRSYGLLIPGCILVGLGIGVMFGRPPLNMAAGSSLGLGLGFIAIFAVQWIVTRASHWWPLIPGGILIATGIAQGIPQAQVLFDKGWPVILIVIGMLILAVPLWQIKKT